MQHSLCTDNDTDIKAYFITRRVLADVKTKAQSLPTTLNIVKDHGS